MRAIDIDRGCAHRRVEDDRVDETPAMQVDARLLPRAVASAGLAPTLRLLALASLLGGLALLPILNLPTAWPLWLAGIGLAVAAATLDGFLIPRAKRFEPVIYGPLRVSVGRASSARARFALPVGTWQGPSWRGLAGRARLDLDPHFDAAPSLDIRLGQAPAELAWPLRAQRRGRAAIQALWLRYEGPLGLMRWTARFVLDHPVDAIPDLDLVRGVALSAISSRNAPAGAKVERFAGDGSEFHAMRAFVPGLDRRWIDWKASARHRRLLAREVRAERNHQVVLAIDTGRLMAEPVDGLPLLDHAIHTALELAWVALGQGDRVALYAFDRFGHTASGLRSGTRGLRGLIDLTTSLAYSEAETNFTLALSQLASRLRRRALILVLTDFVDAVSAELMVENLNRLSRRHLVLFVAFRDPELDRIALRRPETLAHVEEATVADLLLQEREVVLRRLARAGIQAIDAVPRAVGPQVLNHYLEIMRRERV